MQKPKCYGCESEKVNPKEIKFIYDILTDSKIPFLLCQECKEEARSDPEEWLRFLDKRRDMRKRPKYYNDLRYGNN